MGPLAKTFATGRFCGWADKVNARDKKIFKRVLVVTDGALVSIKPGGIVARQGALRYANSEMKQEEKMFC